VLFTIIIGSSYKRESFFICLLKVIRTHQVVFTLKAAFKRDRGFHVVYVQRSKILSEKVQKYVDGELR